MRQVFFLLVFIISFTSYSQKKPLDHSVYDSWQSIGERMISNNGKWVVYSINVQQGDNDLIIQSADGMYRKSFARGYSAVISEDSRFAIFKIRPLYKDTRDARIKKKRAEDTPKDSFAIIELGKETIWKIPSVKTFKTPEKEAGWVAYHLEKAVDKKEVDKTKKTEPQNNKKVTDSLTRVIDSLQQVIQSMPKKKKKGKDGEEWEEENTDFAEGDEVTPGSADAGTDLVLRNLSTGEEKTFNNVLEYYFSKKGGKLLIEQAKNPKDSLSRPSVVLFNLKNGTSKTLSRNGNDFKNFTITEDGSQVAYLAERDAKPKDLQKFYRLWYYKEGMDSAKLLVDKNSVGMKLGSTVSEFGNLSFSKSGKRLFFGTAPIQPPRDTTIIDIDMPKLDIWHYNDDYLQTVQTYPARLRNSQQENFLAVYDFEKGGMKQLGNAKIPQVMAMNEGDADMFVGLSDVGKRVESQWLGGTRRDIYSINVQTGESKLVKENLQGQVYPSSTGTFIIWYDRKAKNYFSWDGEKVRNVSAKIKFPLWNEESEVPDEPGPYGIMGWLENDAALFVYDKYDIWTIDPTGESDPQIFSQSKGRASKKTFRYVQLDTEKRYFKFNDVALLRSFNHTTKEDALALMGMNPARFYPLETMGDFSLGQIIGQNKETDVLLYTKENFNASPDLYVGVFKGEERKSQMSASALKISETKLSSINPQQAKYLWGSAELFKWKAYNGKEATGIVYKPENFDPKKKYPMIVYFYERLSDGLNDYKDPAPIRSAVNVPFFVSRGYIIFMPDIHYTTGHPGKNAYDYIVSGARAIVKKGWADSTKMALQGHSWGGYQAAQVATMTKLFKAIWAGAPVANMTSAYGGIRWESGISRQFQYEKTQSRIGATLWEKPQLYIENSPLFHLNKVTAPMVIMANDADGAVPWYQGIELFTGLRRLGKKVWMFNYNGQGHGLTQRQDMRDYQIRMQQFFDWILKGEKPAKWITEGVPAIKKGKEWGLEIVD